MPYPKRPVKERLKRNVVMVPPSGCWIWLGSICSGGYGRLCIDGKNVRAHRVSWETYRSRIPFGSLVLHRCHVRCCVNPDHLYLGSHEDNMRDLAEAGTLLGTRNPRAILDETAVLKIRKSKRNSFELAEDYGVSASTIRAVRQNRIWANV